MDSRARKDLTGPELAERQARVDVLVSGLGVDTQPKVALRLLELCKNPSSQLKDYAAAVRTDAAITGRLLKLANSAHFAQVQPVTRVDRALVLLGIERTKAISLGFSLSRAAGADQQALSKKVWGESVLRASMASAVARQCCPGLSAQAYVVGLLLDCAQPLMFKLLGNDYLDLYESCSTPTRLHEAECESLEYTHTDVVSSLVRRWRLPELLARPIVDHHVPASTERSHDPIGQLTRVAQYVGAVQLGEDNLPRSSVPLAIMASDVLGLGSVEVSRVMQNARDEYRATIGMFEGVAEPMRDLDRVFESVQAQLIETLDHHIAISVRADQGLKAGRFSIAGLTIEVESGQHGRVVAYLSDSGGDRVISATVNPSLDTPESICRLLGVEDASPAEVQDLIKYMRSMAA